mmetsp:Transcript_19414/g.40777  ORF Transcript_19414/g.40777 Transcript_19414/m.40777 type:complete len:102 (+) Transcript_19414:286-591(+)
MASRRRKQFVQRHSRWGVETIYGRESSVASVGNGAGRVEIAAVSKDREERRGGGTQEWEREWEGGCASGYGGAGGAAVTAMMLMVIATTREAIIYGIGKKG